jgi:DNA-binding transcriptional regulator YiaG
MSTKLSLREVLERPEGVKVTPPVRSGSPVKFVLRLVDVDRPVTLARLLMSYGHSLRTAHTLLNRLADRETVAVNLWVADKVAALSAFAELGVAANVVRLPEVDQRAVRDRMGLSQAEFALRFGFELDTVQNWEQGRNEPDAATRTLLKIIEKRPEVVDEVLGESAEQ